MLEFQLKSARIHTNVLIAAFTAFFIQMFIIRIGSLLLLHQSVPLLREHGGRSDYLRLHFIVRKPVFPCKLNAIKCIGSG